MGSLRRARSKMSRSRHGSQYLTVIFRGTAQRHPTHYTPDVLVCYACWLADARNVKNEHPPICCQEVKTLDDFMKERDKCGSES